MEATIYSTGCPKCKVLMKKLDAAKITYTEVTDMSKILQLSKTTGIDNVPILVIEDGHILDFTKAIDWVKKVGEINA